MDAIQHNAGIRPSADGSDVALLKHMVTRCADSLTDGKNEVSCDHIHKFDKQYDEIIKTAYEEKSLHGTVAKKRGRKKNGNVLNLIGRLFPQREWRTGIPYHYKLHWNSIQAWSQCFYGNPGGIIM